MSDVQVKFKRGNTSTLNSTPVTDGLIYFNTENKHIYMDNGISRLEYSNDMSNFMDKTIIANLVPKNSDLIKNPREIDRIIGDAYIGEDNIINLLSALYQNKTLFNIVWENPNPQSFSTKTISIDGIYPFYFILFDSYSSDYASADDARYVIALNNNTLFTKPWSTLSNDDWVSFARKISISSNLTNNTTTFTFYPYGNYRNGTLITEYSENVYIPCTIMGISNT